MSEWCGMPLMTLTIEKYVVIPWIKSGSCHNQEFNRRDIPEKHFTTLLPNLLIEKHWQCCQPKMQFQPNKCHGRGQRNHIKCKCCIISSEVLWWYNTHDIFKNPIKQQQMLCIAFTIFSSRLELSFFWIWIDDLCSKLQNAYESTWNLAEKLYTLEDDGLKFSYFRFEECLCSISYIPKSNMPTINPNSNRLLTVNFNSVTTEKALRFSVLTENSI